MAARTCPHDACGSSQPAQQRRCTQRPTTRRSNLTCAGPQPCTISWRAGCSCRCCRETAEMSPTLNTCALTRTDLQLVDPVTRRVHWSRASASRRDWLPRNQDGIDAVNTRVRRHLSTPPESSSIISCVRLLWTRVESDTFTGATHTGQRIYDLITTTTSQSKSVRKHLFCVTHTLSHVLYSECVAAVINT